MASHGSAKGRTLAETLAKGTAYLSDKEMPRARVQTPAKRFSPQPPRVKPKTDSE